MWLKCKCLLEFYYKKYYLIAQFGSEKLFAFLMKKFPWKAADGETLLHAAVYNNKINNLKLLIEVYKMDVNQCDATGLSFMYGNFVPYLLSQGATVDFETLARFLIKRDPYCWKYYLPHIQGLASRMFQIVLDTDNFHVLHYMVTYSKEYFTTEEQRKACRILALEQDDNSYFVTRAVDLGADIPVENLFNWRDNYLRNKYGEASFRRDWFLIKNLHHANGFFKYVDLIIKYPSKKLLYAESIDDTAWRIDVGSWKDYLESLLKMYRSYHKELLLLIVMGLIRCKEYELLKEVSENEKGILHIACRMGDVKAVKYCITSMGCDLNEKDEKGKTPLHYCAIDEMYNLILECGGHVDIRDSKNRMPRNNLNMVHALKCLSANCINMNFYKDYYEKRLPKSLWSFVNMH